MRDKSFLESGVQVSYQEGVLCFLWLNRAGIVLVMEYRYYSLPKNSR